MAIVNNNCIPVILSSPCIVYLDNCKKINFDLVFEKKV